MESNYKFSVIMTSQLSQFNLPPLQNGSFLISIFSCDMFKWQSLSWYLYSAFYFFKTTNLPTYLPTWQGETLGEPYFLADSPWAQLKPAKEFNPGLAPEWQGHEYVSFHHCLPGRSYTSRKREQGHDSNPGNSNMGHLTVPIANTRSFPHSKSCWVQVAPVLF